MTSHREIGEDDHRDLDHAERSDSNGKGTSGVDVSPAVLAREPDESGHPLSETPESYDRPLLSE